MIDPRAAVLMEAGADPTLTDVVVRLTAGELPLDRLVSVQNRSCRQAGAAHLQLS